MASVRFALRCPGHLVSVNNLASSPNQVLESLSAGDLGLLEPCFHLVALAAPKSLEEPSERIEAVYFSPASVQLKSSPAISSTRWTIPRRSPGSIEIAAQPLT
jgi:hypothetical protein